jgi:hypothetical protein
MDVRTYYQKVREAEATVKGKDAVIMSLDTPEGGKAGVLAEAPRGVAAKLIAEGRARLATEAEAEDFHEGFRAARERHEQDEAARRVQVVVLPAREMNDPKHSKERS